MKTLIVLLFVAINLFACNFGSLNHKSKSENVIADIIPTPNTDGCVETDYRPKSEDQLEAMTPPQLVNEQVEASFQKDSFKGGYHEWAAYVSLIDKYLRKSGVKILPILSLYIDEYDPKKDSECDLVRFSTAAKAADDLDRFEFRLRGINEGKLVIASLERAIGKLTDAGFANREKDYENNRQFRIFAMYLEDLKGINIVDENIQDTFWVNQKIKLTDAELLEFTNFLISRDPTYPAWSGWDVTIIGKGESSRVINKLNKPQRFYTAYSDFKKQKQSNQKEIISRASNLSTIKAGN